MIINKINNHKRQADIIDWHKQPISRDVLQHKQAKFKQWGFVLHLDLTTDANKCPECDCITCDLTYSYDDGANSLEFGFEVCLSCWQVQELIPVYDVQEKYISDKDYAVLIPLLEKQEYKLVMMILDIFME